MGLRNYISPKKKPQINLNMSKAPNDGISTLTLAFYVSCT